MQLGFVFSSSAMRAICCAYADFLVIRDFVKCSTWEIKTSAQLNKITPPQYIKEKKDTRITYTFQTTQQHLVIISRTSTANQSANISSANT
jgi:hypothetical protein